MTTTPRATTTLVTMPPTPISTLPPKCPQSCCLAQASVNVNSEKSTKIEWTSRPDSELVEFLLSPSDYGKISVEVDFSKTVEMSGLEVSSSVKSFQLFYKQDSANSEYVPYRSEETDDILTFKVNDQGKVFFPDEDTIMARWIKIKEIKLNSDSVQIVSFDVLGCCGSCTELSTTHMPSKSTIKRTVSPTRPPRTTEKPSKTTTVKTTGPTGSTSGYTGSETPPTSGPPGMSTSTTRKTESTTGPTRQPTTTESQTSGQTGSTSSYTGSETPPTSGPPGKSTSTTGPTGKPTTTESQTSSPGSTSSQATTGPTAGPPSSTSGYTGSGTPPTSGPSGKSTSSTQNTGSTTGATGQPTTTESQTSGPSKVPGSTTGATRQPTTTERQTSGPSKIPGSTPSQATTASTAGPPGSTSGYTGSGTPPTSGPSGKSTPSTQNTGSTTGATGQPTTTESQTSGPSKVPGSTPSQVTTGSTAGPPGSTSGYTGSGTPPTSTHKTVSTTGPTGPPNTTGSKPTTLRTLGPSGSTPNSKSTEGTGTPALSTGTVTTETPSTTLHVSTPPRQCKQSCCIATADVKVVLNSGKQLPYTVNIDTKQITFTAKNNLKLIDIDLHKTTEISGFSAQGLKSFTLYRKSAAKNAKFIPVRSDQTDKILRFTVQNGKVFFSAERTIKTGRLQLRDLKFVSGNQVHIDVHGCCSKCPPITTLPPTTGSPKPTLPPSKDFYY